MLASMVHGRAGRSLRRVHGQKTTATRGRATAHDHDNAASARWRWMRWCRNGEVLEQHGRASACTDGARRRPVSSVEKDAGRPRAGAGVHRGVVRRHPQGLAVIGASPGTTVHFSLGAAKENLRSQDESARTVVVARRAVNAVRARTVDRAGEDVGGPAEPIRMRSRRCAAAVVPVDWRGRNAHALAVHADGSLTPVPSHFPDTEVIGVVPVRRFRQLARQITDRRSCSNQPSR